MKLEHQNKLERIRDHLGISLSVQDSRFITAVRHAAVKRLDKIHGRYVNIGGGEEFLEKTASALNITFEEVRSQEDITRLEDHYLKQNNEIAFGQLELELRNSDVMPCYSEGSRKKDILLLSLIFKTQKAVHTGTGRMKSPTDSLSHLKRKSCSGTVRT